MTESPPDLTRAEIDEICDPLTQGAAQIRYLRDVLKVTVSKRPNGRPLVNRARYILERGGLGVAQATDDGPRWTK